jgi:hypothetical protein
MFENTTPGAFLSGIAVGIIGVNTAHSANLHSTVASNTGGSGSLITHTGWNIRRAGTGPIAEVNIVHGAYVNTNANTPGPYINNMGLTLISPSGANGLALVTTNSIGGPVSFAIANPGFGFSNNTPAVAQTSVVNSVYLTGTATGWSNSNLLIIASPVANLQGTAVGGEANAVISFTTNSTGGNLQFTISNAGYGFTANANGAIYGNVKGMTWSNGTTNVTSYTNGDLITIYPLTWPTLGIPAVVNVTTNSTGGNLSFGVVNAGSRFTNVASAYTLVYSNASGAHGNGVGPLVDTFTPTFNLGSGITLVHGNIAAPLSFFASNGANVFTLVAGGRANRVHYETLVALGTIGKQGAFSADSTANAILYSDLLNIISAVANTGGGSV